MTTIPLLMRNPSLRAGQIAPDLTSRLLTGRQPLTSMEPVRQTPHGLWPDKAARDKAMPKMMEDPRTQPDQNPMPFDGKRLVYGGFAPVVEVS